MKHQKGGAILRPGGAHRCRSGDAKSKGIVQPTVRCVSEPQDGCMADDGFREQMIAFLPRLSAFALSLTGNADQRCVGERHAHGFTLSAVDPVVSERATVDAV